MHKIFLAIVLGMKYIIALLLAFVACLQAEKWQKVTYQFPDEMIDVVIPCVRKDLETLELAIEGIRKNGKHTKKKQRRVWTK